MPTTLRLTFLCLSQRFWVAKMKATCVTSARQTSCPQESHSSFCSLFTSSLAVAANSIATGPDGCGTFWRRFFGINFLAPCFLSPIEIETGYMD